MFVFVGLGKRHQKRTFVSKWSGVKPRLKIAKKKNPVSKDKAKLKEAEEKKGKLHLI